MNKRSDFISTEPLPDSMRFEHLLDVGIRACQTLAGEVWTDYNEHDPGVTILEQLCYALTDLAYRTDYPVADLLAPAPDGVALPDTLYSGDRILSAAPLTDLDYRKLVYDEVHNLRNVWFENSGRPGIYRILLEPYDMAGPRPLPGPAASALYHAQRNLGEDAGPAEYLDELPVNVAATLHVAGDAEPAEVLADVLFAIEATLTPVAAFDAAGARLALGAAPEDVFCGPLLQHGVLDDAALGARLRQVELHAIRSAILGVATVQRIEALSIWSGAGVQPVDAASRALQAGEREVLRLVTPRADQVWRGLQLRWKGQPWLVDAGQVARLLERRHAEQARRETFAQQHEADLAYRSVRRGQFREQGHYQSIQHQFPLLYGIGQFGSPDLPWPGDDGGDAGAARRARIAQARQLKAYLLLFEQLLANQFAQLAQLARLFSVDPAITATYFHQPLLHAQPDPGDPPDMVAVLMPAQVPAPAVPELLRYRTLVLARGRGGKGMGEALLRGRETNSAAEAQELRATLIARGAHAHAYQAKAMPDSLFHVTLTGVDGKAIGFGTRRYVSAHAARRAGVRMAAWMRRLATHPDMATAHVVSHERGGYQLVLADADGAALLTLDELRARDVLDLREVMIEQGQRPGRWEVPHGGGSLRLRLGERPPFRHADGVQRFADGAAALAGRDALIELFVRIACEPRLRDRLHTRPALPETPATPDSPRDDYVRRLDAMARAHDPAACRRNQFLDHLLARVNEAFDDELLAHVDPRPVAQKDAFYAELATWKAAFLLHLVAAAGGDAQAPSRFDLGGRRSLGYDYTGRSNASHSGLALRLRLLLGIACGRLDKPAAAASASWRYLDGQPKEGQLDLVLQLPGQTDLPTLLRVGTDPSHYQIREQDGSWRVLLLPSLGDGADYVELMRAPDRAQAQAKLTTLIEHLRRLRSHADDIYADEDLDVVEHVLLRPRASEQAWEEAEAFRVSLVLPAWPLRFQGQEFRQYAEKLAAANCPAHLALECHWLDAAAMDTFRQLHLAWKEALAARWSQADAALDAAAADVHRFLDGARNGGQA